MATFSIDNLLSKPFVSSDAEKDGLQKQSHLQVTPSSNPLSLSSSQEPRVRPQMMYHRPTAAMFANPLSGIYDSSGAPYASQSVMAAALEQYQAKRASSPAGSLADSWTEGDPEEERSSLERRKEDLEEERDDSTSAIGGDESDSDQADCSGKSDSKAQLEPRRMLIKDTNGQIKELIFPRGLDLDRPKRERTSFTPEQLFRLEKEFRHNQYMVGRDRGELATCLGLTETQVKVWFQNRRTKYKREKQREQENKKSDIDAMAACSMFKILEQSTGQYYTASGPRLFATPHPNNPNGASVVKSLQQLPSSSSQTPIHKIPGHPASAYMMPPNLISAQMNMHANKISPAQSTATSPGSNWPNLPHNPFLPSSLYWIGTPN